MEASAPSSNSESYSVKFTVEVNTIHRVTGQIKAVLLTQRSYVFEPCPVRPASKPTAILARDTRRGSQCKGMIPNKGLIQRNMYNTKSTKIKGKAIPLQAWTGPEGSRRLKLPDFKTIGT